MFIQKEGESEEKEGKEEAKEEKKTSSSSAETKNKPDGTVAVKPKRVYEKQPLLIPFDLVHGNSVRVFCAICRREYLNRYLLKVRLQKKRSQQTSVLGGFDLSRTEYLNRYLLCDVGE